MQGSSQHRAVGRPQRCEHGSEGIEFADSICNQLCAKGLCVSLHIFDIVFSPDILQQSYKFAHSRPSKSAVTLM